MARVILRVFLTLTMRRLMALRPAMLDSVLFRKRRERLG
jgi:hypothetical protein